MQVSLFLGIPLTMLGLRLAKAESSHNTWLTLGSHLAHTWLTLGSHSDAASG
jgi:hypothetical protein